MAIGPFYDGINQSVPFAKIADFQIVTSDYLKDEWFLFSPTKYQFMPDVHFIPKKIYNLGNKFWMITNEGT